MKRLFTFGIVALFVLLPLLSSARTIVADDELAGVTAEAGVTIDFTDLNVNNTTLTSVAWGDTDGFTGYTSPGWTGITGVNGTDIMITGNLSTINGEMNIDVGSSGSASILRIGLPDLNMGWMSVNATLVAGSSATLTGVTPLCFMEMPNFITEVRGTVQISAH
ncbi:MAG: hypothetical protein WBN66_04980 [Smithella sp.]